VSSEQLNIADASFTDKCFSSESISVSRVEFLVPFRGTTEKPIRGSRAMCPRLGRDTPRFTRACTSQPFSGSEVPLLYARFL
jgi:hypothetical protein